jgi:hypothetical protein
MRRVLPHQLQRERAQVLRLGIVIIERWERRVELFGAGQLAAIGAPGGAAGMACTRLVPAWTGGDTP